MFNFLYTFLKDFGILSLTSVQFIVILFFMYKFGTNHWKHLTNDVKKIIEKQENQDKQINCLCERVSKIEGELE
jgi:hypothetical protein